MNIKREIDMLNLVNKYSIRDVMENKMRLLVGADSHVGFVIICDTFDGSEGFSNCFSFGF